jgi:hypothetical protein
MPYQIKADHWLVDPKYILTKSQENNLINYIDKNFKEGQPLALNLELEPGTKTDSLIFRPYAGSQTYIYTKNDVYLKALPCDSEFLMLVPHIIATKLKRLTQIWAYYFLRIQQE